MTKAAAKSSEGKTRTKATLSLEQVSDEALQKLRALGLDEQLQRDLEWCLGSYRNDSNPVGLYGCVERTLTLFKEEREKKTRGITAKAVNDLEKVLRDRDA